MVRRVTRYFMGLQDDCEDPHGGIPFQISPLKLGAFNLPIIYASSDLFTTCSLKSQPESLSYIPQLVSNEINSQLPSDFMAWEIHTTFKQMASMKAPGPDGSLKQPRANVGIA